MEQKTLPVYGDGENVRDWLYVIDHCNALVKVFEKGVPGETYNIGGNSEKKNIDIVTLLCKIMDRLQGKKHGSAKNLIKFVTDRPGHDRRYAIDSTKIQKHLGWKPEYEFEGALEKTVIWYLKNKKWVESVKTGAYMKWIEKNCNR
jgi:dTDP-glucose 4,6-dehydratase